MIFDAALTATLREKLDGLDVSGFVPPTVPEIRVAQTVRDVLRPSNMHRCERALTLTIRALPFTSTTPIEALTAMNWGTHVHRKIQAFLELPNEIKVKGPWLRGSKDLQWEPDHSLDLKTIDRKGFLAVTKAGVARDDHRMQQTWYSTHSGDDKASVVYIGKPANGSLPEKINGEHIAAFTSEVDRSAPHPYDEKLERIRAHHNGETLPPYEAVPECRWCPVQAECFKNLDLRSPDYGFSKIVGQYAAEDPARLSAFIALKVGDVLRLEWEPANPHGPRMADDDSRAAAVKVVGPDGTQVGYLPATGSPTAQIVARHIRSGGNASAVVTECTGGDNGKNHGRNIELALSGALQAV
ncbi:MAG: HIRAN domain-containing protein [Candidatus Sericytochromatia bacterium]|uniref:HIRAN domain-containing protein n=1 Tax=Candidatus Tanganyikabacteria bacterium TaxID=2961651 RepID=A0A937X236_9BACT|nr:HIRAN domain-containing protein [Candidatus Tanganyikabacteria bacterium]